MKEVIQERPLDQVIQAVKNLTPLDFTEREGFFRSLDKIIESIPYTAPEAVSLRWEDFMNELEDFLGDPSGVPWKFQVVDVVSGKTDYKTLL